MNHIPKYCRLIKKHPVYSLTSYKLINVNVVFFYSPTRLLKGWNIFSGWKNCWFTLHERSFQFFFCWLNRKIVYSQFPTGYLTAWHLMLAISAANQIMSLFTKTLAPKINFFQLALSQNAANVYQLKKLKNYLFYGRACCKLPSNPKVVRLNLRKSEAALKLLVFWCSLHVHVFIGIKHNRRNQLSMLILIWFINIAILSFFHHTK